MDISNQIRAKRIALRVSQIALARAIQMSRYRLSMFECGYKILNKDELAKIKVALTKARQSPSKGIVNV